MATNFAEYRKISDVSSGIRRCPQQYKILGDTRNSIAVNVVIMIGMPAFGMGSIIFYLSAHNSNMISMLLKSIPAVVVGILIAHCYRMLFVRVMCSIDQQV